MRMLDKRRVVFILGGHSYEWYGYFGCQLSSWEWRKLPAGTTRKLDFGDGGEPIEITIASADRQGIAVFTAWSVSKAGTTDEYYQRISGLRRRLWMPM